MMDNNNFQTPPHVARFMASLVQPNSTILEPTPGAGNLVRELEKIEGAIVTAPEIFSFDCIARFDYIVMNPPFTPMKLGYDYLYKAMDMSDNIIALMPWLTLINSKKRLNDICNFGLVNIYHLPRDVFPGSRVQCCILEMSKGWHSSWDKQTQFKWLPWIFDSENWEENKQKRKFKS